MVEDIIRVLRIIEYVGPRSIVERSVAQSIHGTKQVGSMAINAVTIGNYPEIIHPNVDIDKTIMEFDNE